MDQLAILRQSTGAARCVDCGKCTTMCPLASQGSFSARLIAGQDLQAEVEGRGVGVGRCLTCASCEVRCPQEVRFTEFVRGLREMISPEARRPCPHAGLFQTLAISMAGDEPPARGTDWVGDDLETAEEGETALFVGCLPFFDLYFKPGLGVQTIDIARAAIRVLNSAGIRPVLVPQERCCGHDLRWGGEREAFAVLARENTRAFAQRGVKHILTPCAECCRTWRLDYAEAEPDYQPRVEHIVEFLSREVKAGKLRLRENGSTKVTYQDPCRLARHLGITDAPRHFLESLPGVDFREMGRSGRDALCCGTSGFIHCDAVSRRLQAGRLEEATATGADTLLTACPKCLIHFSCAQAEDRRRGEKKPSLGIRDITVLAAEMVEKGGEVSTSIPARDGRETGVVT